MKTQNYNSNNERILIAVILGFMTFILAILISMAFQFNIVQNLVMSWVMTTVYAIVGFLITAKPVFERRDNFIVQEVVKEKPILHIVPDVRKEIQFQTIDNPIVEVVEKPVEKRTYIEVPVVKEKIVYKEKPRKKLNIPKYKFVGSSESKTYHKRNCRFSKLIKRKYKISNNSESYFKKKKFKKCKICFVNKK